MVLVPDSCVEVPDYGFPFMGISLFQLGQACTRMREKLLGNRLIEVCFPEMVKAGSTNEDIYRITYCCYLIKNMYFNLHF